MEKKDRWPSEELCKAEELPYYAKVIETVVPKPGCWAYLKIGVFKTDNNEKVGEYIRNYSSMFRTFYPFKVKDKWYALYSKFYTGTRIMSLPDCKDIGGEVDSSGGFCPREFFVPTLCGNDYPIGDSYRHGNTRYDEWIEKYPLQTFNPPWAFVSGMIWGGGSDEVEFIDLSKVEEGIINRTQKFGLLELPDKVNLYEAITIIEPEDMSISNPLYFENITFRIAQDVNYKFNGTKI